MRLQRGFAASRGYHVNSEWYELFALTSYFVLMNATVSLRNPDYLRTLMIQGAKSAVMSAAKRDDPISTWLVQLTARVGWQKACVAMANKNARILWAVMTRDQGFDPRHVSIKPQATQSAHEPTALAVAPA